MHPLKDRLHGVYLIESITNNFFRHTFAIDTPRDTEGGDIDPVTIWRRFWPWHWAPSTAGCYCCSRIIVLLLLWGCWWCYHVRTMHSGQLFLMEHVDRPGTRVLCVCHSLKVWMGLDCAPLDRLKTQKGMRTYYSASLPNFPPPFLFHSLSLSHIFTTYVSLLMLSIRERELSNRRSRFFIQLFYIFLLICLNPLAYWLSI